MIENLQGSYKGIVTDGPDSLNRVQVRVKGYMDDIPKKHLPWAEYHTPTPTLKGGTSIPATIGAKVSVGFYGGDINFPYYTGGVVETKADLSKNAEDGRYILYESPSKSITITVNDNLGDIEIKTSKYNTTLNTIMGVALDHVHNYILYPATAPLVPTTKADLTTLPTPPIPVTDLSFNTGKLL